MTSLAPATRSGTALDNILQPVVELEPLPPRLLDKSVRSREDISAPAISAWVEVKTHVVTVPPMPKRKAQAPSPPPAPEPPREVEKTDANMCLNFTFGVNAWKQWVMKKNADLEKSTLRRKPFKSELLQMTADELNYSLCLFFKEMQNPNGSEYAPDTIYYLVLGKLQFAII